jgi:Fe-S-cluster containining protein
LADFFDLINFGRGINHENMSTERNAPCSCGSGKKYKKCCGLTASQNQNKPDYIAINRDAAYKGVIGRKREAFSIEYTAFKKARIKGIESTLKQQIVSVNKTLSCSQGCAYCCSQFVVASLQECECITYQLYHHEKALEHFIRAFNQWRDRIFRIERCFRKINNLGEKINFGQATDEDRRIFVEGSRFYAIQNIPCPFLIEGACSIYEVRPFICAGIVSVSTPEWCQTLHPNNSQAVHYKISSPWEREMPYFLQSEGSSIISSLPFMVYRILEEGYDTLSAITGLENLRND